MTHPSPKRNMVPKAVLMRSGLVSLTTARPVNTAQPKTTVNSARPMTNVFNKAHSTVRRPIINKTSTKTVILIKGLILLVDMLPLELTPKEGKSQAKVPRKNNMYSVDLKNIIPKRGLTCLFAKATSDESKLWHRRLGHINFKTMNKLVKGNLVRGLPSKIFENDQTCVACQKGKQHRASCKSKTDETSGILKSVITGVENLIDQRVKHFPTEFARSDGFITEDTQSEVVHTKSVIVDIDEVATDIGSLWASDEHVRKHLSNVVATRISNENVTFKKQCTCSADLSSVSHIDLQEPVSVANPIATNVSEYNMSDMVVRDRGVAFGESDGGGGELGGGAEGFKEWDDQRLGGKRMDEVAIRHQMGGVRVDYSPLGCIFLSGGGVGELWEGCGGCVNGEEDSDLVDGVYEGCIRSSYGGES
ncbi:putative ribonuclease H-like domain-containing protein [Tanacetum coccineum]